MWIDSVIFEHKLARKHHGYDCFPLFNKIDQWPGDHRPIYIQQSMIASHIMQQSLYLLLLKLHTSTGVDTEEASHPLNTIRKPH